MPRCLSITSESRWVGGDLFRQIIIQQSPIRIIMLIGEAPIENSTTASKIAIQASAKKGGTSKHKNKSRQGRVKVEKKKVKEA